MSLELRNKTVTIVGLGRSGVASAELVLRCGARVKVSDVAPTQKTRPLIQGLAFKDKVLLESGGHTRSFIEDSDLVVVSPGVRSDAEALTWAREKNIPVLGEIELAWQFCPCPVIAVTGSNGKTTTTTLIAEILKAAGRNVCLCGNIGSPFTKYVLDLKPSDLVALEVSSFQMETITTFRPHVAVFLNFSQNHLDRHKDLDEYFNAKSQIFMNQTSDDFAVLDHAEPRHHELARKLKAQVLFYNQPGRCDAAIENPNHLAALAACEALGVPAATARKVFAAFKGVEHRQEFVRTVEGVDYVNDSKSTTVEAGRLAMTLARKPLIFICGGRNKHLDFSSLRPLAKDKVKKMIVIGEAREELKSVFSDVVALDEGCSLEDAVSKARAGAQPGDCVILSPMCASFDMFDNFEHRGKEFKRIVGELI